MLSTPFYIHNLDTSNAMERNSMNANMHIAYTMCIFLSSPRATCASLGRTFFFAAAAWPM